MKQQAKDERARKEVSVLYVFNIFCFWIFPCIRNQLICGKLENESNYALFYVELVAQPLL